ncbi:uncharacterized protein E5676_scaffold654G00440 [Cucumis melo var. makuwa]|uniref:Transposase MuDR plant domain-containing protein n=1 Tax=Cucumis melo var. makuwa TaxID=1194695 RepID=A0A5A7V2L1_CUCMM|nr:uncharacterized protein E6C27_scaffold39G00340 [Cucumis melo var. makuwa]TYK08429.1 uncharacterized protein E5676_scaffold654G00440 [Cucumis melo var. makuwa]
MPISNMVHLYVNVSRVGLDINLNSEPFGQLEDRTQVIVPNFELVASSVYDDEEMVANNEYMDFRTERDDEFEEFDFDGPPVVVDNSELYKRMICQDKETLQHMVKYFAIKNHASYEVVESTPTIWAEGCTWRLRASKKKAHEKPSISITQLQSDMKTKFGYHVPYHRAWDGKRKVVAKVFGNWDESYKLLPKWLYMVKRTNPGTCVEWRVRDTNIEGKA